MVLRAHCSSCSSSAFPKLHLWGSPFWVRVLRMWPFLNPAKEVVAFRLHGWWILGVFLLPSFIRQGNECQDLLSLCDGMHVCTDYTSVYTLIRKKIGGMESEPMLTPREKIPSSGKILPRGGSNPWCCIKQDSKSNTLPMSYSGPRSLFIRQPPINCLFL